MSSTSSSRKNPFDRIIDAIEWMAALFVGIVAANIFIAVLLRKFFDTSIPDSDCLVPCNIVRASLTLPDSHIHDPALMAQALRNLVQ